MTSTKSESTVSDFTINWQPNDLSAWFAVGLRLLIGYVFFAAGWDKLTAAEPFNAKSYLSAVGETASPVAGVFDWMSVTPLAVEFVNIAIPWGEVLVGLGLLVGAFTRLAAIWGAFIMLLLYLGNWTISNGTIVTQEFEYMVLILSVAAFGSGRMFGLDAYVEQLDIVQRNLWLKYLLG